ncbi:unnamed protein product [Rotaria sp. Silwood2]|nr:unnamed protein product [Rotaria sp. Silwood2]CAF2674854.1 unnamed protein product [Rotaria sp. Silwood2]CAF2929071.1 unnamed protein product [Rotaria sp. Silwood2]CAF3061036.1 unnamed protein product [Rotaria sp. Silwood2]CAF3945902.1 unnamed protein product [Rotaria sp. Silwood2]
MANHIKSVEKSAKECNVHVYVKGSYYQMEDPAKPVLVSEADIVIGHGFRFELRNTDNSMACNKLCLSRNPKDIFQVKCFLESIIKDGLVWSVSNPDVISDGTYEADKRGYQDLKIDIQTKCKKEGLKRELLQVLRRMEAQDSQDTESDSQDATDDTIDKKKK